jgi:hypothetical protein
MEPAVGKAFLNHSQAHDPLDFSTGFFETVSLKKRTLCESGEDFFPGLARATQSFRECVAKTRRAW